MRANRWIAAIGLVVAAISVGCASGPAEAYLYEGPPRPANAEAVVRAEEYIFITHADGKPMGDRLKTLHLPPGPHALKISIFRPTSSGGVLRSNEPSPLSINAAAGRSYVAGVCVVQGKIAPVIDPPADLDPCGKGWGIASGQDVVDTPSLGRGAYVRLGTATVCGVAYSRSGPRWYDSYERRDAVVVLMAATPEIDAWLNDGGPAPIDFKKRQWVTRPLADGAFTFRNVAPGSYYAAIRGKERSVYKRVEVGTGQITRGVRLMSDFDDLDASRHAR